MKYLYLKSEDAAKSKYDKLVPVDDHLSIQYFNGVAYLACGDQLLIDVDAHNEKALIPFLADTFNKCDVVTINLTGSGTALAGPIVKRGLEG